MAAWPLLNAAGAAGAGSGGEGGWCGWCECGSGGGGLAVTELGVVHKSAAGAMAGATTRGAGWARLIAADWA